MDLSIYKNKKVLVTGHTGFKGAWLCLWLELLGAKVTGYSIDIPTKLALFKIAKPQVKTIWGDVCDLPKLKKVIKRENPEIVFHLAAQPLVRASYHDPIETFETNVLGTANVLEAIRGTSVKAAVIITTDKVYENNETGKAFKENNPLGGHDPYSASKAAAEIVVSSYRNSFFKDGTLIASVRAGNVIGGGDFAVDRLIPDCMRAFLSGEKIKVRNPKSVRPWQHVLEPLYGYLLLGQKLLSGKKELAAAWNFGPEKSDAKPVEWIVRKICSLWPDNLGYSLDKGPHPHEAHYLKLDITKAKKKINWQPRWDLETALAKIVVWTKAYAAKQNIKALCVQQIKEYSEDK